MLEYKIIAWFGIVFFMLCWFFSWKSEQGYVSLFFLFFVGLGLLMLSVATRIQLNEETVIVYSLFAKYQMKWSEVKQIEIGSQGAYVFHSESGKRLVMPSTHMWSGKEKQSAYEFMDNQIDTLKIRASKSHTADFKIHKKVMVKNA